MRVVLFILILTLASSCRFINGIGKEERKEKRRANRAVRLVIKAKRLDPTIVKKDSVLVSASRIDTFIPIDTSSGFVDTAFNDFADNFRVLARGYDLSHSYVLELEALVAGLRLNIKDSVRSNKALLDTFYYNNDTLSIKVWQEGGKLRFDVKMNDIWVRTGGIEVKQPTWYEKNHWWLKIMGVILAAILIIILFREGIRKLLSKPK